MPRRNHNAETFERLKKVTMLVVDKTGTLTEGKPKLINVLPTDGIDVKDFLRLAASLEQNSEQPLAAVMSLSSVSVISNALRLRKVRL